MLVAAAAAMSALAAPPLVPLAAAPVGLEAVVQAAEVLAVSPVAVLLAGAVERGKLLNEQ